jgi:hypothetical protein
MSVGEFYFWFLMALAFVAWCLKGMFKAADGNEKAKAVKDAALTAGSTWMINRLLKK